MNVRPLKSGLPMIIAMIGMTKSFTNELMRRCERQTHHECNGELDEVPAHQEVAEFLEH